MQLFAGALLDRPPGPKYTAELGFAEIALREPLPKPSTLAKWRTGLPAGFELALRAPERCWSPKEGPLRPGPALDEGLAWLDDAADALGASFVVISTGPRITTGARDRKRLQDYFERISRPPGRVIVWHPTGLWETETLQPVARSLGVTGGFDVLDDPVPEGELVYGSLPAEGRRRSFSHAQLLEVVAKLQGSAAVRAFITIDSPQSFREARLLQRLSEGRE